MGAGKLPYQRVLLKLSGEALGAPQQVGIHQEACRKQAQAIKWIVSQGLQLGIVIGGGNIFRGMKGAAQGMARPPADQIGLLATLMNAIALQQALQTIDCPTRILTALECPEVAETYTWTKAMDYLAQGQVVIFAGGTGNTHLTTDTAAALRACEIQADLLLKATKVDGIYNKDPMQHPDAIKYDRISYSEMLAQKLGVMDSTAVTLCMTSRMPILVLNMSQLLNQQLFVALTAKDHGTWVNGE